MKIRTRFAPSPTGFLHVGGLRTALFAYLFAKKHGGEFILRIEDTDRERLVDGAIQNIIEALQWAGFTPDEGVTMIDGSITEVGQYGPYVQSERKEKGIYNTYAQQLIDVGHAYYAFDTPEELDVLRADQQQQQLPPRYNRLSMTNSIVLSKQRVDDLLAAHTPFVIRMNVPVGETTFTDMVRGDITIQNSEIDDQILIKSDGYPTYHFAVVVDDHLMQISHVIRAEEWIPSTPKHILLYQMFGWDMPQFAHLPLLINEQKQKLSKRHGDVSVQDFKEGGFMPQALVNFVSFLGWNPGTEEEIFSLSGLEKAFDMKQVSKSSAVFDRQKLTWYNQQYIRKLDKESLYAEVKPFLVNLGLILVNDPDQDDFAKQAILLEQERSGNFKELAENIAFLFVKEIVIEQKLLVWKKSTLEDAKQKLTQISSVLTDIPDEEWNATHLEEVIIDWIKDNQFGVGDVLWPVRVALSGKQNSPGPFDIMSVLKKQKTLERLQKASHIT